MNDEIIAFEKVTKKYGSDVVLDNVSFPIKRNSVTTLVGPNGAGKSTIAKLILGIEFLDSGKIMMPKKLSFAYLPQKIYISTIKFNFNTWQIVFIFGFSKINCCIAFKKKVVEHILSQYSVFYRMLLFSH